MKSAWQSRKFLLATFVVLSTPLYAIAFAKLGVSEAVSLTVIGAMAGATGLYGFANVASKRSKTEE